MGLQKTVLVNGEYAMQKEAVADAGITPGMFCEKTATGCKVHATAGARINGRLVAIEDDMQGKGITDAYVATDIVRLRALRTGNVVNAILAGSQTVTKALELTSNGDGTLKIAGTGDTVVAIAEEAVTTTGAVARILVEMV